MGLRLRYVIYDLMAHEGRRALFVTVRHLIGSFIGLWTSCTIEYLRKRPPPCSLHYYFHHNLCAEGTGLSCLTEIAF